MAPLFRSNNKGYFCYALKVAFISAMVLLMTTVVIELVYHFRPYFWSIMIFIFSQMQLGMELVIKHGTVLIHNLICFCSWLISSLFNIVHLSFDFIAWAASEASSVFWKIMMIIYSQIKLGLEIVITQGTVLMQNLICLFSWLISSLFNTVRLSFDFVVWAASEASSVFWKITVIIYRQMQLGLEIVITQGTVLMHNLMCLCSWLISSLFNIVRLSFDFVVWAASEAISFFRKLSMIIYPQMKLGLEIIITQGTVLIQNLICFCSWLISSSFNIVRLSYDFLVLTASEASSVLWKITIIIYLWMRFGLEIVIAQGTVLMQNLICFCSWLVSSLSNIVRLSYNFLVLAASEASSVFWKITMIIYPQMKLGLEIVITQGTVLTQNLICFCSWLISSLFNIVRLSFDFAVWAASEASLFCWPIMMMIYSRMKLGLELVITRGMDLIFWSISIFFTIIRLSYAFLVLQASKASSAVTFVFWWLVGNVSSSLKGITSVGGVAKLLVYSNSLSDSEHIWSNWQFPVCCVIALIGTATCLLAIKAWCHGRLAKLILNNCQDLRTDRRPDAPICQEFILGKCKNVSKCTGHHCSLPFQWQYVDGQEWESFKEKDNEKLEQSYCDVNLEEFSPMVFRKSYFGKLQITQKDFERFAQIRRLSTESYVNSTSPLATEWIWYWKHEDGGWRKYGQDDTGKDLQEPLEKAFLEKKNDTRFRISDQNYILRFDSSGYMSQKNVQYGTIKKVRRRPAKFVSKDDISQLKRSQNEVLVSNQQGKYTSHWDPMPSTMQYKRVPLPGRSDEFKKVEKLFKTSIKQSVVIINIERVQNRFMWEKYQRKKENMAAAKTGSHQGKFVNEKQLFHGTSCEIVEAICKQNFDWRLYGKNATAYGEGSYFALNSSYSNSYAKEDSKGSKFMFVAKVLVGCYTTGQSCYRRPPPKDLGNPASDLYDSCVDSTSCPTIFVVFDDDQCYPEYIIEYSTSQRSY